MLRTDSLYKFNAGSAGVPPAGLGKSRIEICEENPFSTFQFMQASRLRSQA
jgi:hypothetical protein